MTTNYAQEVHTRARQDVREQGRISASTAHALLNLGYAPDAVADLERRLLDNVL